MLWKVAIEVLEPCLGYLVGFQLYPTQTCLGLTGYVAVVVVVVVVVVVIVVVVTYDDDDINIY